MVYARDHSEPMRISSRRNPMCSFYAMEKLCRGLKERNMLGKYASYLYLKLALYFMYVLNVEKMKSTGRTFIIFCMKKEFLHV